MITKKMVENLFERFGANWLKQENKSLGLDDYAPPGNRYRWRPVLINNASGGESHPFFNERMGNSEMRAYFMGALYVLENPESFEVKND